jgi:hypothetical protein
MSIGQALLGWLLVNGALTMALGLIVTGVELLSRIKPSLHRRSATRKVRHRSPSHSGWYVAGVTDAEIVEEYLHVTGLE